MDDLKNGFLIMLTKFFDQAGVIRYIEERLEIFENEISNQEEEELVFHCPISLDLPNLNNYSALLMNLLLEEPIYFQNCVLGIVESCVRIFLNLKPIVCAPLALTSFPPREFFNGSKGLRSLQGIVSEETIPESYVKTSKWKCNADICTNMDAVIVKNHTTPNCEHCAAPMEELVLSRTNGNRLKIKLITLREHVSRNTKAIFIDLDSGLYQGITLGDEVQVVYIDKKSHFEAWGYLKVIKSVPIFRAGSRVEVLRQNLNNPWKFVQALAGTIGHNLLPCNYLKNLRMFILLSLASVKGEYPIPILAVGKDTNGASKLFKSALEREVARCFGGYNTNLSGFVNYGWKQAGIMILSTGGICYLGDLNVYSQRQKEEVRSAIESGEVHLLNSPDQTYPLRTAIWAYIDEPRKKKDDFELKTAIKSFGLVWNTDEVLEKEEDLVDFMLEGGQRIVSNISLKELKNYVDIISHIKVTLLESTIEEIKKYFACARRLRGTDLPLKSLELLNSLTKAHARLNQRNVGCSEDALVAFYLCEMALGPFPEIPPPPKGLDDFKGWLSVNVFRE